LARQVRRHVRQGGYDKDAKSGSIEVTVDVSSITSACRSSMSTEIGGNVRRREISHGHYTGKFTKFTGATPTEVRVR